MNSPLLASELRAVVAALHKGLRKQISAANTYSMTELETISLLFRNPSLLPTELAASARITTQSMSQILSKLEKEGIVLRTPSEEDKRKVYISLTDAGKKLVEQAKYDRDEWLTNTIRNRLTEEEKELLTQVLPILHKLIEFK
jgi:DNA-binding MarR family transcriptional regulator